jgi:hypothetical protein
MRSNKVPNRMTDDLFDRKRCGPVSLSPDIIHKTAINSPPGNLIKRVPELHIIIGVSRHSHA